MIRKSDKRCLCITEPLDSCFDLIRVSSAVYTVIFPTGDRTNDYKMRS